MTEHKEVKFNLTRYILPAIISMVVVGTNANIDGLFIGRLLADDGLAAINIAWPIVAAISSLGTGIGIGGSVLFNRARGEGNSAEAERIKNTTLLLLLCGGVLSGLVFYLSAEPLLVLMGADGNVLKYALEYSRVISAGAVFQVVGAGMLVLLRNDGKTYASMIYSLIGLALHIALNFVFADALLMGGVALSTVISQGVISILSVISIGINKSAKPALSHIPRILLNSAAPFGLNFVPSLVLLFTNAFAMDFGGVSAVSAYAAMSYAVYTFDYIFQGVCDGIQPVVSYCRGSDDKKEEARALKTAAMILGVFSLVCIALTPLLIKLLPPVLGVSGEAKDVIKAAFWIYAISYPFKAFVKYICSYYYASGRSMVSNILVYLDPLCFTPVSLFLFTMWFGTNGVWLSMPISQIAVTACAIGYILIARRKKRKS